jgi:pyruvate-ferredoxin/flavodoxin oxidoreductase
MQNQKAIVESGQWLLYRFNPERTLAGENPLQLDSRTPTRKVQDFLQMETRFKMLTKSRPEDAKRLWAEAQHDADIRYRFYEYMASRKPAEMAKAETRVAAPRGQAETPAGAAKVPVLHPAAVDEKE